jgi:hypothetical protein
MRTICIAVVLLAAASACAGCATTPSTVDVPERLSFVGTMDLSGQGIGFLLSHHSGLSCTGRYASGRLPDPVSIEVICNDRQTGVLTVTKSAGLRGAVELSDGRQGDVIFDEPPPRIASPPPVIHPPSVVTRTHATRSYVRRGRGGCGSRGGPGYRLPSGKCASHRRH